MADRATGHNPEGALGFTHALNGRARMTVQIIVQGKLMALISLI
jgi:hypothetical protein